MPCRCSLQEMHGILEKKHEKPTIGDAVRPVEIEDIARANKLLYAASLLGMIVFCGIRIAVWFGIKWSCK